MLTTGRMGEAPMVSITHPHSTLFPVCFLFQVSSFKFHPHHTLFQCVTSECRAYHCCHVMCMHTQSRQPVGILLGQRVGGGVLRLPIGGVLLRQAEVTWPLQWDLASGPPD